MTHEQDDRMLGAYLRTHRNYAGMTLQELTKKAGLRYMRYAALENGNPRKSITRTECVALASALNLNAQDLEKKARGEA